MPHHTDQLPHSIGAPAARALAEAGITTLTQVAHLSDAQLLALHGVGPKAVRILREHIRENSGPGASHAFRAELKIIGINPYVDVPEEILAAIFTAAGKDKGPVPVRGTVNGAPYQQTLVRYAGQWRLYINTQMLKKSPERVGEVLELTVEYDPEDRSLPLHPALVAALDADAVARQTYEALPPSRRHEINRYISGLKSEAKVAENVGRAIEFLHGRGRFVGRDGRSGS